MPRTASVTASGEATEASRSPSAGAAVLLTPGDNTQEQGRAPLGCRLGGLGGTRVRCVRCGRPALNQAHPVPGQSGCILMSACQGATEVFFFAVCKKGKDSKLVFSNSLWDTMPSPPCPTPEPVGERPPFRPALPPRWGGGAFRPFLPPGLTPAGAAHASRPRFLFLASPSGEAPSAAGRAALRVRPRPRRDSVS